MGVEAASVDAGQFADERFRARRRAWWRRVWWIFPTLAVFEVAVCVGLGLLLQPEHMGFFWGFGLGLAAAIVMVLADSPPHHIERWRQGAEGEKATAKALRRLVADGWLLINDIDISMGNVDHVLVGPPGVFLLDSKNLHGVLSVSAGVLSVRWREDLADGYENRQLAPRMRNRACLLEAHLRRHGVTDPHVQPVVVLWGAFDQGSFLSGKVAWIRGSELARVLKNRPTRLSGIERQRLAAVLEQPWRAAPQRRETAAAQEPARTSRLHAS